MIFKWEQITVFVIVLVLTIDERHEKVYIPKCKSSNVAMHMAMCA